MIEKGAHKGKLVREGHTKNKIKILIISGSTVQNQYSVDFSRHASVLLL